MGDIDVRFRVCRINRPNPPLPQSSLALRKRYAKVRELLRGLPSQQPARRAPRIKVAALPTLKERLLAGDINVIEARWKREICVYKMHKITMRDVIKATAEHFKITHAELISPRKSGRLPHMRGVAYQIIKEEMPGISLPMIARAFGDRDHTTIMQGCRRVLSFLAENDPLIVEAYNAIREKLGVA